MISNNGSTALTVGEIFIPFMTDNAGNTASGGFASISSANMTVTSLGDPERLNPKVLVYPNPTEDYVIIEFDDSSLTSVVVRLSDIQGRELVNQSFTVSGSHLFTDFSDYPSGTYILSLLDSEGASLGSHRILRQ